MLEFTEECANRFVCFYKVEDKTCEDWKCALTECTAYCECESCMIQDHCSIKRGDNDV